MSVTTRLLIVAMLSMGVAERLHWTFVHYKKTGHDLCSYLTHDLFNTTITGIRCKAVTDELHKIGDIDSERGVYESDAVVIRPHQFYWEGVFNIPNHSFRVVHFVREPFDMVVSGYLYHRQIPFPAPEPFLGRSTFDPCEYDPNTMHNILIPSLTAFTKNRVNIPEMVEGVVNLCYSLRKMYPAENFNKALNKAKHGSDVLDGMRLEACRALLQKANGDILRMAHNTLQEVAYLKNHSNVIVRRTFTSEFPVTNMSAFHASTVKVFKFLMQPAATPVFYDCITEEEAVRVTLVNAFSQLPKTYSHNLSSLLSSEVTSSVGISKKEDHRAHITSDQISSAARKTYIQRLEEDMVLGPLLLIVRMIVFNQEFK